MKSINTIPESFISKATLARCDDWAFKLFLCGTLFIVIFSVTAIHSWPPMVKHASILLACMLPVAMVVLVRLPTWFREREIPKEVLWVLLVFILGLISSLVSENPWPTAKSTVLFVASGPIIFVATRYLLKPTRNQIIFLWMTILITLCFGILGVYEHSYFGSVSLFSENPLPAGASLILLSASPMIILTRKCSTTLRPVLILSLISMTVLIILLAKKGPVLSLVVILLFSVSFINRKYLKLLLCVFFLMGSVLIISKLTISKNENFFKLGSSFTLRAEHYFFGSHVFKENPVWGVGFHADLTRYLDDYTPQLFEKEVRHSYQGHFHKYNTFENIFLAFLVEMGGLFSITYLGGVTYLLIVFLKKFCALPQKNLAGVLTIAVLVGFVFISCTFDTLRFPNLNWLFHSFLGLMVNLPQSSVENHPEPS